MNKIAIFIVSIFFITLAQTSDSLIKNAYGKWVYKGNEINKIGEVQKILLSNNASRLSAVESKYLNTGATAFAIIGISLIGVSLFEKYYFKENNNAINNGFKIGAISLIISIPIYTISSYKFDSAIRLFNASK